MTTWCKKLALVLAIAVMPFQGIAATLSVLLCHGDAKAHAMHSPESTDHSAHQGGPEDESGSSSHSAYHPCCNHIVSAPPVVAPPAALPEFPVLAFTPDPWHDLFVPQRPQRPPLA